MSEETVEYIQKLQKDEFKYQRLADAARTAQDSVGILANVIHELIGLLREQDEAVVYAERCLSRTPYLRKMPITHDLDGEYRYVMDLPMFLSPFQEEEKDRELKYLRRLAEDRSGYTTPWRFVTEPKI